MFLTDLPLFRVARPWPILALDRHSANRLISAPAVERMVKVGALLIPPGNALLAFAGRVGHWSRFRFSMAANWLLQ